MFEPVVASQRKAPKLEFAMIVDLPVACAVQANIKTSTKSEETDIP